MFADVGDRPDDPEPAGGRQFPRRLEARRLREDARVRERVDLVVQPVLKGRFSCQREP